MSDPYATLGIEPAADESAIRAAYRALMKRYHPDQNPSADAADKAREVAAAYRLLCDPEQRARYDRQRALREQVIAPPPPARPRAAPRGRLMGVALVILSVGIVGLAITQIEPPKLPSAARHPAQQEMAEASRAPAPELREPTPPPIAPLPSEPAPMAEAAPPPTVEPEPATPVAALPQAIPASPLLRTQRSAPAPAAERPVRIVRTPPPAPLPVRTAAASLPSPRPSRGDDCDTSASCARIDLAALERMQIILYNQSYLNASSAKQARLLSTRAAFLSRLGRCASASCKRDAYLARNREIAELMRS